jgi:glycosyltransferase
MNSAKTIQDTLDSVISQQTPFQIEHICIDGGSIDGTRELIDLAALRNQNLITLYEPDKGLFDAMNKGLRLAAGRYVLFLNSDDFLLGSKSVANALACLDSGACPDMVMGDVIMGHLDRFSLWRKRRVPRWLPSFPRIGAHPPHQGNFIRRETLLRVGGFDSTLQRAGDTTQFYRLVHEFNPTMVVAGTIVSFMRMGGVSNKRLSSLGLGNVETYRFLRKYRSPVGAAATVVMKVLQKLVEYRLGRVEKTIARLNS